MLWVLIACEGDPRVVDTVSDVLDAHGIERLSFATMSDNLAIVGTEDPEIAVTVELTTTRSSITKDDKARMMLHLELRDDGGGEARAGVWFDHPINNYMTDVAMFVPRSLDLSVVNEFGAVHVENVGGLELDDGDADAEVVGVARDASFIDQDGDLKIQGVGGNVDIDDGSGDIKVEDVTGVVKIQDGSGDITVVNATKVKVESDSSGEVTVK